VARKLKDPVIVTAQRNGKWFVDPIATVIGAVRPIIAATDGETLRALAGLPELAPSVGTLHLRQPVEIKDASLYTVFDLDDEARNGVQCVIDNGTVEWMASERFGRAAVPNTEELVKRDILRSNAFLVLRMNPAMGVSRAGRWVVAVSTHEECIGTPP
jgi:hypothetical protein